MEYMAKNIGFTLIELVIVLVIIGIITIIATVKLPSNVIQLGASADQVAGDIRYTQALAMTLNQRYRINFASNSYSIEDANSNLIKHPVANSTTISLTSGTSFNQPPTPNCIAFNGIGAPCDCSTDNPLATETIQLVSGNNSSNITVTEITGYVSVSP
jgi:prepilin-type N-terminal cleavage/methylation domain-containing protein